jgi:glycosyltransferase involved in cell wall biosynthesis
VRYHINADDTVYCTSDALGEVLPGFLLKNVFRFNWIPTFYLFVPSPVENLRRRYGFPVLKYFIYYFYQRLIFLLILMRGDRFVITNDVDKKHFPKRLHSRIFAIYGGVNCEQIRDARLALSQLAMRYDVLFCGRLHPQKGISRLLDVWKTVVGRCPEARLGIIGNGDPGYEALLKDKASNLGLAPSVDWLGYVNNEEKYRLYLQSRIFVHATVYDNNGMVAAEALCSGLPVVMYDLPALRDVYNRGCLKVRPGDRNAYADTIISLIIDSEKYDKIKPTPELCAELQTYWDWQRRADLFDTFVWGVDSSPQNSKALSQNGNGSDKAPILVSVVRDLDMYRHCYLDNPFAQACTLCPIDNRQDKLHVSQQYNRFLDAYDYSKPAWLVFCHEDFELKEPIGPLLVQANDECLYGPIGAWTEKRLAIFYLWRLAGQIVESRKDGSAEAVIGESVPMGTQVETFDCQCLIAHSGMIQNTGLRFDPALSFDLYVEDFCIQAKEQHQIPSLIIPISCKHWSNGQVGKRYHMQEAYLRNKYTNCCYTGTSSYDIGTPCLIRRWNASTKALIRKTLLFAQKPLRDKQQIREAP